MWLGIFFIHTRAIPGSCIDVMGEPHTKKKDCVEFEGETPHKNRGKKACAPILNHARPDALNMGGVTG